jgi:hypothetical protein
MANENFQYLDSSQLPADWSYPLRQYILALPQRINTTTDAASTAAEDISNLTRAVTGLENDYVSKTHDGLQSIGSGLSVNGGYYINNIKVVGARLTGWSASIGEAKKTGLNADTTYTVSNTYTQSEIAEIANGLVEARQVIKGLQDALQLHGLIDGN